METKLIAAALQSREAYSDILSTETDGDFSDKAQLVWKAIDEYYNNDHVATEVDIDILRNKLKREYPKHADMFSMYLDEVGSVSIPNLFHEIIETKLEATRHRLAQELISNNDSKVPDLLDKYNKLKLGEINESENKTEVLINPSVSDIIEHTSLNNRIAILPASLNAQLKGGVLRQHHVVLFAPTDMGKTLFALNMVHGFLKQNLKVVYCGNEDPADDMINRLMWRVTGMTEEEMHKDKEGAQTKLDKRNFSNLVFAEMSPGTPAEIESLVVEHKPDVLIVDQIRNLNMGDTNKVTSLEKAAQMMRRIGKEYDLVPVSLTQAADSATGKLILSRGDIDSSNVGIPGTADLLLGIGATAEMEVNGERMVSFVKNKISGVKTPVRVWFDTMLTKVK